VTTVRVNVRVPGGARPGDYLSGVSVQALTEPRVERLKGSVAVASVQRYAVGLLVRVPGVRTPLIRLPRASVKREPSGLTFYVSGTNAGNAVLQNVHGYVLVTQGKRVVARTTVGPGTFVAGTSLAYPLLAPHEQPREGAAYRVRAAMHYSGSRVARLDTRVVFGHRDAVRQEQFGGPAADGGGGSGIGTLVLLAALAGMVALLLVVLLRRRKLRGRRATRRVIERAIAEARDRDEPLTALKISDPKGGEPGRRLAEVVGDRLRRGDELLRMPGECLLVLCVATAVDDAALVAVEVRRHVTRRAPEASYAVELVPLHMPGDADPLAWLDVHAMLAARATADR
jgi:hypothetical protein